MADTLLNVLMQRATKALPPAPTASGLFHPEMPSNPYPITPQQWDRRPDGTQKGNGFLGVFVRPDNSVMSEFSIADSENPKLKTATGDYMDYPTFVPTLTKKEIETLLSRKASDVIPESIKAKAEAHALKRLKAGKSVFAEPGEENTSLY